MTQHDEEKWSNAQTNNSELQGLCIVDRFIFIVNFVSECCDVHWLPGRHSAGERRGRGLRKSF